MATQALAAPERLRGRLVRKHRDGYGFISIGAGNPEFFVMKSQLPHAAWNRGVEIEFTPMPARRGTRAPRAGNPAVLSLPPEDSHEPDYGLS